jgi:lysophospholipase L1-like esterase
MNRSRRSVVVVAVAVVVIVLAVLATDAVVDKDRGGRRPGSPITVPVVGDSITYTSGSEIGTAFGGRYRPEFHAKIGQRIDQMLPTLRTALEADPYAVVVNLGTNDVLQGQKHPDWQSGFASMVDALSSSRCVVLTTISTTINGSIATPAVASAINRAISEAVSDHRNVHIADWNAAVHGPNGGALLNADRVHPSPAGQAVLARLLRAALDRSCFDS